MDRPKPLTAMDVIKGLGPVLDKFNTENKTKASKKEVADIVGPILKNQKKHSGQLDEIGTTLVSHETVHDKLAKVIEKVSEYAQKLSTKVDSNNKNVLKKISDIELTPGEKGDAGEKGDKGDDGDFSEVTPVFVRDALELLKDDERLDASAIKGHDWISKENLDRAIEILDKRTQYLINKQSSSTGGAVSSLTTTGSSGAATLSGGVLNIPVYTGTQVREENVAASGTSTNFTLLHTPQSNTLQLFRGGSRITVYGGDYTISGNAITLTSALNIAAGETLSADYSY